MYGDGPYWTAFRQAIAANATFDEAVGAASRLRPSRGRSPVIWTPENRLIVRTEYDGTKESVVAVAKKIGVTPKAVRVKISRLKVAKKLTNRWPDVDKDVVRTEYDGTRASVEAIAAKLHRTPVAVKGQVQHLKLAKIEHRNWTSEDLEYLADTYGLIPDADICEHLHRSLNGIAETAKRRLQINRKTNSYTARDVTKALGLSDSKIITETWMSKGFIKGQKSPTRCGRNLMWHFDKEDIVACLKERPWLVDRQKLRGFRQVVKAEWKRDPWYNTKQAGRLLGHHPHTIVLYLNRGSLAGVKKPALCWQGEWVIRRSAIQAFQSISC
jgi:hypothetical protein